MYYDGGKDTIVAVGSLYCFYAVRSIEYRLVALDVLLLT